MEPGLGGELAHAFAWHCAAAEAGAKVPSAYVRTYLLTYSLSDELT